MPNVPISAASQCNPTGIFIAAGVGGVELIVIAAVTGLVLVTFTEVGTTQVGRSCAPGDSMRSYMRNILRP